MTLPIHRNSLYVPLTSLTALLKSIVTETAISATRSAETGGPCFLPQFEYPRHVSSSQHNVYDRPPQQTQHPPQHYAYEFDCPRHDFYPQHNAYDNPPQQAQALPQQNAYNIPQQPAQPEVNFVNDSWQPYSQQGPDDLTRRHTVHQGDGSWEPYGAQFTYDRPPLTFCRILLIKMRRFPRLEPSHRSAAVRSTLRAPAEYHTTNHNMPNPRLSLRLVTSRCSRTTTIPLMAPGCY